MDKVCCICGRPQGIEQTRKTWSLGGELVNVANQPERDKQFSGEMLVNAYVSPNGGGTQPHICDDCLRVALRFLKVAVSKQLMERDQDYDKDAALVDLNARLAHLQCVHHNACFDHDRMQDRLAHVLNVLDGKCSVDDEVKRARWEVSRGHLLG